MKAKVLTPAVLTMIENKAVEATAEYIRNYGEHPFNCGFAWVIVKGARGKKSELLKKFGFKKNICEPGISLWNPSGYTGQDMSAKMSGATVYARMLCEYGINAEAHCRLD